MSKKDSYYDLLGISKDATIEEIRRAYHNAAHELHPDVNFNQGATELFLKVQEAYGILSNPASRDSYDMELASERNDPVTVDILYSRSNLVFLDEPQLIHVLLDLSADKRFSSMPDPPLNVCLVIDRSTSMQGPRMDTVKTAAVELIRQTNPADILSIVTFSDRAEVLVPAGRVADSHSLDAQIHMVHAGGGTEIYQGLETGFFEISRYSTRSMVNHIFLLTDGRTYGDEEACLQLTNRAASQGIRITGIGIGTEWNDAFLDELSTRTGGNSFYISRIKNLRRFLKEKLEGLHQSFAERVIYNFPSETGVTLNSAYRIQPDSAILQTTPPIRFGNILKNSTLSILLEFIVQPIPTDVPRFTLTRGELSLLLPFDPSRSHKIEINLNRLTSRSIGTESPPKQIFKALSQIALFRMQEVARQDVASGRTQEAYTRLQRLAKHLFSSGEKELAQTAIVEAERIQQTNMFSEEGEKRIKYGTRAFLLPSEIESEEL